MFKLTYEAVPTGHDVFLPMGPERNAFIRVRRINALMAFIDEYVQCFLFSIVTLNFHK
jgi:hypothetical protein